MTYDFVEGILLPTEISLTGRKLTFQADTPQQAIQSCLYTERLANGNALVGPSGRVVYSGDRMLALTGNHPTLPVKGLSH